MLPFIVYFNILAPCGARPEALIQNINIIAISIHSPRAGRDKRRPRNTAGRKYFNPLAPCGARLAWIDEQINASLFQSTRPVWGETVGLVSLRALQKIISIHSPRAGRDGEKRGAKIERRNFNPLAPCGARPSSAGTAARIFHFNPLAPCGARPHAGKIFSGGRDFNPLAPCGARPEADWFAPRKTVFQSTRPVRGETWRSLYAIFSTEKISIHSPRAGRDRRLIGKYGLMSIISIHSPRAGRDAAQLLLV